MVRGQVMFHILYFACNSDFIISMPFPLKIRDSNKRPDGRTDGPTDGQTDPHIEMGGCI